LFSKILNLFLRDVEARNSLEKQCFFLTFAYQNAKHCQKNEGKMSLFLYNKVSFARKSVSLHIIIRLLERDEWMMFKD